MCVSACACVCLSVHLCMCAIVIVSVHMCVWRSVCACVCFTACLNMCVLQCVYVRVCLKMLYQIVSQIFLIHPIKSSLDTWIFQKLIFRPASDISGFRQCIYQSAKLISKVRLISLCASIVRCSWLKCTQRLAYTIFLHTTDFESRSTFSLHHISALNWLLKYNTFLHTADF